MLATLPVRVSSGAANWSDTEIADVERMIDKAAFDDPDFWSILAQTQLDVLKSVLRCRLQRVLPEIEASLNDLHNRISTQRYWIYVHDDACFLLNPYLEFAACRDDAEVDAAGKLMKLLKSYSYA